MTECCQTNYLFYLFSLRDLQVIMFYAFILLKIFVEELKFLSGSF